MTKIQGLKMNKSANIQARIDPNVKNKAQKVLDKLFNVDIEKWTRE